MSGPLMVTCTMRGCTKEPRWIGTLYMPMMGAERRSSSEDVRLCDEHKADYERMAEKRDGYYLSVREFDAEVFTTFWRDMYVGLENARVANIEEVQTRRPWWKFWV